MSRIATQKSSAYTAICIIIGCIIMLAGMYEIIWSCVHGQVHMWIIGIILMVAGLMMTTIEIKTKTTIDVLRQ